MRVIAGEFGRRKLVAPRGDTTRPTPDRMREALFSIITPQLEGAHFTDFYSGSGAVGLEAVYLGFNQDQRALLGKIDGATDRIALGRGENRSSGVLFAEYIADLAIAAARSQQYTATDQNPNGFHCVLPRVALARVSSWPGAPNTARFLALASRGVKSLPCGGAANPAEHGGALLP